MTEMLEHAATQARHPGTDVLLVTVAEAEAKAVLRVFPSSTPWHIGDQTYHDFGTIGRARICMVQSEMGSGGSSGAMLTIQEAITTLHPSAVIMVGIAFGTDQDKQRIGDILVSRQIVDYEPQRVGTSADHTVVNIPRGDRSSASPRMLSRFRAAIKDWQQPPEVQFGLLLSGDKLVDNQDFLDQLLRFEPEAIGGEMEGAGLYATAQRSKVDWIVVKAICDWADGNKAQRKRSRQKVAAENAAKLTLHVLEQGGFTRSVPDPSEPEPQQKPSQSNVSPRGWRLPLQRPHRTAYFIDREQEQAWLQDNLKLGRIVTVCGPGGMGKTALIAEVLWGLSPGNDPPGIFPEGIVFYSFYQQPETAIAMEQIARTFGEEPLPTPAHAAQRALSGRNALLVFDGAEEAANLKQVLEVCGSCAVLVTSQQRADAPDPAYRLDLRPLPEGEAVTVVQRWGKQRAANAAITAQICQIVGNLPLALSLVGRYLEQSEEEAADYLRWLQETPLAALHQGASHRESVPLLLERSVTRVSEDARRILTVIGFLAFAPFRRELIARILDLSDAAAGRALGELVNYGLILRPDTLYEVSHRLIHTYAYGAPPASAGLSSKHLLAERIVQVLNELFPDVTYASWGICEELLPHVQAGAALMNEYALTSPEAVRLLTMAGWYAKERASYAQAESFLRRALSIAEQEQGIPLSTTGLICQNLAQLYQLQGSYPQAEAFYQRALALGEQAFGHHHPNTTTACTNLAQFYRIQSRYDEAETLLQRALVAVEHTFGPAAPETASVLGNLALLDTDRGHYAQAESLYQRTLSIQEQAYGPDHPETATTRHNLALLYRIQGKHKEAEPLLQQALSVYERTLGPDHPDTAVALNNLALLYQSQGKYDEAEALLQRALSINERALRPDHPEIASTISHLVGLYEVQGRYPQVEALLQRALVIQEQAFGRDHPQVADTLTHLAILNQSQGQYPQAESLLREVLTIYERALGSHHPQVGGALNNLAQLYLEQDRYDAVEALCNRALDIYQRTLGPDHHETGRVLHNLAQLYYGLGQYTQAEPLYQQALAISEQAFGPHHPNTAAAANALALLYKAQERYVQAEQLLQRALTINEQSLGPNHPRTIRALTNLAGLYKAQGQYVQAEPLLQRALVISEQLFGLEHPNTISIAESSIDLQQKITTNKK